MSKNTENYKLYTFTNDSDVADLKLLEPTFDTIDKGLVLDVGESSGSGNNYELNLGSITLTSANKGISFKFWSDKDSKGAVTINGTYKLIKAGGSSVTNLKKGAPYTITYDGGTNFFLASGGGADTVNFTSDKLLTGYSANDSNGEKINGTMPNQGSITPGNSIVQSGDKLYCRIPQGAYFTNASSGYPEISYPQGDVANALGLTANKIVAGNTIGGIAGTATIQSLGGAVMYKYENYTTISGADIATINIPYAMDIVLIYAKGTGTTSSFRCLYSCMLGKLSVGIESNYGQTTSYRGYSISKLSDTSFKITTGGSANYIIDVYGFKL